MKRIWAPWRIDFLQTHDKRKCVFCQVQKQVDGSENLIIHRGKRAFVILNRYPYTGGHIIVVADAHLPTFEALDKETRSEIMELATQGMRVLRNIYKPEAFNVGANIGEAAGAGIVGHVHMHVVPRWNGDTNFMATVADTRVLPESLEDTYRRIYESWKKW